MPSWTFTRCPMLITCRVLDYQAEPLRQIAWLPHSDTRQPDRQTDPAVCGRLVRRAGCQRTPRAGPGAGRYPRAPAGDPRTPRATCSGRAAAATDGDGAVHANSGTLPDARALLYKECIDLLCYAGRQPRGAPDLLTRLDLSQFRTSDLLALMARLGFAAHEAAERSAEAGGLADLSETQVIDILAQASPSYDLARRRALAPTVLDALAQGNVLLRKRGPNTYAFPHRTFQEFLAGYHLKSQRDYRKALPSTCVASSLARGPGANGRLPGTRGSRAGETA